MLYYTLIFILAPVFWIIFWPKVIGWENLKTKGGVIYISNHRSMWDPVLLALITPRFIHFMAKEELFESKFIAAILRMLLAFPIKRKTADIGSVRRALKIITSGKAVGIFPEGKRAVTDGVDEMEKGAAFMAVRAGVPVIPIYIPPNMYGFKRPTVMVGNPIDISATAATVTKSALVDVVADKFADSINLLKAEYEEKYDKNNRRG